MTGASQRSFAPQHTSVLICFVSYMWVLCDIVWLSFGVIAYGPTRGLEDSHLLHVISCWFLIVHDGSCAEEQATSCGTISGSSMMKMFWCHGMGPLV